MPEQVRVRVPERAQGLERALARERVQALGLGPGRAPVLGPVLLRALVQLQVQVQASVQVSPPLAWASVLPV